MQKNASIRLLENNGRILYTDGFDWFCGYDRQTEWGISIMNETSVLQSYGQRCNIDDSGFKLNHAIHE
jgi:hypothetical protein